MDRADLIAVDLYSISLLLLTSHIDQGKQKLTI